MARIEPPPSPQLTSFFTSSKSSMVLSEVADSSRTTRQNTATAKATVTEKAHPASCKRIRRTHNGSSTSSRATASILCLVLLDLWGAVPIIILITTTGSPTNVSAVSIATVSVTSSAYGDSKGNVVSGNFDNKHQQQPVKSPLLSFLTGNDAKGNGSTVGKLNLSFGEITFANQLQQEPQTKEMSEKAIKNKGVVVKRSVGDTRIISNHDVTTLALAIDNSSSVAIANINSSYNTVHVTIGSSPFPNRFDPGNRFDPFLEDDK